MEAKKIQEAALSFEYKDWIIFCNTNKLTRKAIVEALVELINDKSISEQEYNHIDGLVSGVEGNCAASCVDKYYGDPDDQREIVYFARSKRWMNQDYYSAL